MERIYNREVFVLSLSLKISLYTAQMNGPTKFRADSDSLLTAIQVAEKHASIE